ncbi:MAG: cupin domain-containing protein [Lysobacterales bacterium]|nr:cupin domain-containing protein [Xanthomonadales bacterium]MCP5474604.1 cupin domain-containing protein [Rhodanobacteraceae bacterium]
MSTSAPDIEVRASARHALGMPVAAFLRHYWQKQPLLIRGAIPDFVSPLTPDDLAGLACIDGTLGRIVRFDRKRDRWHLENGPFAEARFAKLPKRDWTLLVQDMDRWDPEVRALLRLVDFLPRWRVDDIMVSYAAPGGSVGAHVDQYDVFLLQGMGQRRWQIDARPNPSLAFRDDAPIRLLQQFEASHEWLLDPGDMLYLPPGVPHFGEAENDCLTFSIGMRAPSAGELLAGFAAEQALKLDEELRYADPDLAPTQDPGAIDHAALTRLRQTLSQAMKLDDAALGDWFGRFLSLYRAAERPRPRRISPAQISGRLEREGVLVPASSVRLNFTTDAAGRGGATLHGNGESIPVTLELARLCTALNCQIDQACFAGLDEADRASVVELTRRGWLSWQ